MTVPASAHLHLAAVARARLAAQRVVLVEPSHPGNIGAVCRAMTAMGLSDLVLVRPREPAFAGHPEAIARASGAVAVLAAARMVESLPAALQDCQIAVAVSAEPREFGPRPQRPADVVDETWSALAGGMARRIAWVFGPERTGLSIADVARCGRLATIAADPSFASLNLAQAVQIIAYVLRERALADGEGDPDPVDARRARPPAMAGEALADLDAVEGLFAHLERALITIGFLDRAHPKKLMARLRRLFGRTGLRQAEVELLRGVCRQMERGRAGEGSLPGKDGHPDERGRPDERPEMPRS